MILEALPEAHWTSYADLADAIGTAPRPLGSHVAKCPQCANAHRVLTSDGVTAADFTWTDPADARDPTDVLREEGLAFIEGHADQARRLTSDDLDALVMENGTKGTTDEEPSDSLGSNAAP